MLNQHGDVFQANSTALTDQLPKLYGPEGSEQEVWRVFLQLHAMLRLHEFNVISLALSERFAWQLWLDNGVQLNLGREQKAKRIQRFIDVYPKIYRPDNAKISKIDLRYDTGLAVSWL